MSNGLRQIRRRAEKQMPRVTPEWVASVEERLAELARAHNALVDEFAKLGAERESTTPSGLIVPRGV